MNSTNRIVNLLTVFIIAIIGIYIIIKCKNTEYEIFAFTILLPLIFLVIGFGTWLSFSREERS